MTAVDVLLVVAVLEVAINRVAVPMLRPAGVPPVWHTYLDYAGLFLFYFAGSLAALLLGQRCWRAVSGRRRRRTQVAYALVAITTALAAAALVFDAPAALSLSLELALAASVMAIVLSSLGSERRDPGVQVGLVILAVPLLIHCASAIGGRLVWPDVFDGHGLVLARIGVIALCLAALATPYCFAPRPLVRAVIRPLPVLVGMAMAGGGALLARSWYPVVAKAASLAIGVELAVGKPDPRLAMYLLAAATLAWTLASCAIATSPARRSVGAGLALVVLAGYAFKWPHHYLLPLLGMALIADAARAVREQERAALPPPSAAPAISDPVWSDYLARLVQGLRCTLGDVHSLTSRGEAGFASSLIVGESRAAQVRIRIERIEGGVVALDVVVGREIDEVRPATLTVWAQPQRALGVNPAGPPAAPAFKTGDALFDQRFRTRGSALAFHKLFDDGLRARAVATIDGWIAWWDSESVRYRVYPGRGAPLDHPIPLSDLAFGKPAPADRLVAVVELLVELAARGTPATAAAGAVTEPGELV